MKAVYKRELASYFNTMIGYIYVAVVLAFVGLFFSITNLLYGYPYFASALATSLIVIVLTVPILTMKSMAEERRMKTDQLLLTSPVTATKVILGKYFAMMTVYAVPLIVSCLCPLMISLVGKGSFLIDYSAILAFLCLGCLFVAIGMFISSLTESQIIAAVASYAVFLLLFFWSSLTSVFPESAVTSLVAFLIILAVILVVLHNLTRSSGLTAVVGVVGAGGLVAWYALSSSSISNAFKSVFSTLSITDTLTNFTGNQVFDLKGLLFFLTVAALFVFLTIQSVQRRRWN